MIKFVNPNCSDNSDCAGAGTELKATSGWNKDGNKSGNGTNDFGFSALPGGYGYSYGVFLDVFLGGFLYVGDNGYWWSATEHDASRAYCQDMIYNYEGVARSSGDKSSLISVRCLQD